MVSPDTDHDMEVAVHKDFGWVGDHQEHWVDQHYWPLMWREMKMPVLRHVVARLVVCSLAEDHNIPVGNLPLGVGRYWWVVVDRRW